jgi:DnaJ domain
MLGPVNNEFSIALVNACLLALLPVLPILLVGCMRQSLLALRVRPVFSLRKFESDELTRAAMLYEKVCRQLKQHREIGDRVAGLWGSLLNRRSGIPKHSDEIDELEAHAQYLRITIMRFRRRPLLRLKAWLHIRSSRFAYSRALVTYVVIVSLLIVVLYVFEPSAWAGSAVSNVFMYPIDERLFYANGIAAGFAVPAAPVFYLVRRFGLRRQYSLEFCVFRDLARTEPVQLFDQFDAEEVTQDQPRLEDQSVTFDDRNWYAVLGLPESASIEEVRKAYKALIKQNHPDRVHDMSPALRTLAESETKLINAAYRQALHLFALRV